jgi:hypothetical protein
MKTDHVHQKPADSQLARHYSVLAMLSCLLHNLTEVASELEITG